MRQSSRGELTSDLSDLRSLGNPTGAYNGYTAVTMYREMDMPFLLEQAEADRKT